MAAETSKPAISPDSYIGCLISLTSKFEIRYEGVLYNINTEESSLGLQNVRSFGTEGRKKDGPQVPASDKIYEYILFRGSDIKDLQVKSSPPAVTAPIHNDPAIIQSHYSHPASASTSSPAVGQLGSGTIPDVGSNTAQFGLPRAGFQGGLPLQQSGGSLGPWGPSPSPSNPNGSGLAMPLHWPQGYYTPSGGLPHLQQPSFLRPPPGLPISMQQPLQFPTMNAGVPSVSPNLAEFPPPLFQPIGSITNLTTTTAPSTFSHIQASSLALDTVSLQYKPPVPAAALGSNLPLASPLTSNLKSIATVSQSQNFPTTVPTVASQTLSQSVPSTFGSKIPSQAESSAPLVTPGKLLEPGLSTFSSSQPMRTTGKVEAKPPEAKIKASLPVPTPLAPSDHKEPILPLPVPADQKPTQAALQTHYGIRGRGRGRGRGDMYPRRSVTKFWEDFDFIAMNEKFKKEEVWGHLGKSKAQSGDRDGEEEDEVLEEDRDSLNLGIKPVYVKDDFFDSLSTNALDSASTNRRTKFSERLKMDTETFGDFQRHRGGWSGGRGPHGGRVRGSYYGRGYGYGGRGPPVRGRTGNRDF